MSQGKDFTEETFERRILLPLDTREEGGVERLSQASGLSVRIEYD